LTIDGAAPTLRAMARETAEESGMNYARCPDGWLLAHNIVRPEAANTRNGWKGFRRFWISPKKKKEMEKRACGSAGAAGDRTSGHTTPGPPSNFSSTRRWPRLITRAPGVRAKACPSPSAGRAGPPRNSRRYQRLKTCRNFSILRPVATLPGSSIRLHSEEKSRTTRVLTTVASPTVEESEFFNNNMK